MAKKEAEFKPRNTRNTRTDSKPETGNLKPESGKGGKTVVIERRKLGLSDLEVLAGLRLDPEGGQFKAILEVCDRFEAELQDFLHPDNPPEKRLEAATGIWAAQQLRLRFIQWNLKARETANS